MTSCGRSLPVAACGKADRINLRVPLKKERLLPHIAIAFLI